MTPVALSIGSNIEDREFFINSMEQMLRYVLENVSVSALMETEPVGVDGPQTPYLNKIIFGNYAGTPRELLNICHLIERKLGRSRKFSKEPRTADVDILLFGDQIVNEAAQSQTLVIPHPELQNRRFCIVGLRNISSNIPIPPSSSNLTVGELYENMDAEVAAQNVFYVE